MLVSSMEPLGPKIRRMRRRLGLTLDELAAKTRISKPYLSLIETQRVTNPPSDGKLQMIEQALGFPAGELITQAHLQRTPRDVRVALQRLIDRGKGAAGNAGEVGRGNPAEAEHAVMTPPAAPLLTATPAVKLKAKPAGPASGVARSPLGGGISLDDAYLSGVLHDLVDKSSTNVEGVRTNAVPVINKVSAGYPKDFTDMNYPPRMADEYVACPDVFDKDAFAARVSGDSMTPKYVEGDIVVFSPAAGWREGNDCFVRFDDGQTTFKRVFMEKDDASGTVLRLQPRNERYRPQVVPSEKISGLYKAVYQYRRVDED